MADRGIALVTGGSSGIGLAFAERWIAAGGRAALVARGKDRLDAAVAALGDRASAFPADVSDAAAMAALPGRVVERLGGLDVLVNNAGVNHRGAVSERTAAQLAEIVDTNLIAPIRLTHAALPHLRAGATIVNVASLAGKIPVQDEAAYSASKAGLRAFTAALRLELAGRGVHVASVCPGPVDTPFFGDELAHVPDLVFSQPMSTADDVADAIFAVIDRREAERDVPWRSGKLATLGYLFPTLAEALKPRLSRRGAAAKAAYVEAIRARTPR